MKFAKYHALGNDYLVIDDAELAAPLLPAIARRLCDRHRGIGADGVLWRPHGSAAHRLVIVNPDGSTAEKSGNGLRIFARFLFDRGVVGEEPFEIETAGGAVRCQVLEAGRVVAVEMGRVSFQSELIPVAGPPREVLEETLEVAGTRLHFSAATIGNPHCVIFRERVTPTEAQTLGPLIECHPLFPRRTNVQFVEVLGRSRLKLEIWERGAGYTLASGTSSCAAAAVALRLGHCERSVRIEMPGGELQVELGPGEVARLTGPVTSVARGEILPEALEGAR